MMRDLKAASAANGTNWRTLISADAPAALRRTATAEVSEAFRHEFKAATPHLLEISSQFDDDVRYTLERIFGESGTRNRWTKELRLIKKLDVHYLSNDAVKFANMGDKALT